MNKERVAKEMLSSIALSYEDYLCDKKTEQYSEPWYENVLKDSDNTVIDEVREGIRHITGYWLEEDEIEDLTRFCFKYHWVSVEAKIKAKELSKRMYKFYLEEGRAKLNETKLYC